jgi:hypothetical protein
MGIPENHPAIIEAKRRGLIEEYPKHTIQNNKDIGKCENDVGAGVDEDSGLLSASYVPPGTWVLPIKTASEANGRDWRKRSNRTQQARRIVSRDLGKVLWLVPQFGERLHLRKQPLVVRITRLGGRKLDLANLGPALKATEDAVALMLGIDDGDPRWQVEFHQEPGGPYGVRLELILP